MKTRHIIGLLFSLFVVSCSSDPISTPQSPDRIASPELSAIDSMMWQQPDSALVAMMDYWADSSKWHDISTFNRHYAHVLTAELLYKNDYQQSNREEVLQAVPYFDTIDVFLSARAHYINGVGNYENDSVVAACSEYLKALEIMEEHFEEKEMIGNKAQFEALAYTHLLIIYSAQYLHEQAIYFGQLSLYYYQKYKAYPWHKAWVLNEIGSNYNMMGRLDSADYYYHEAIFTLNDTATIMHRDIMAHLDYLAYQKDSIQANSAIEHLKYLISISENEQEQTARYSYLCEILFHEKQFDSAKICLEHVFQKTTNIGIKRQAAERIVAICQIFDKNVEILEYASFLAPFANQEENKSEIKSQLTEFYKEIGQRRLELGLQKEVRKHVKRAINIIVGLTIVTLTMSLLYHRNKHHKKHLETLIESERQTHKMQQAALGGRLRQSNAALKGQISSKQTLESSAAPAMQKAAEKYEEELICQQIIALCNDKKNPIKSTVPISAYANIALNDTQKAQLKNAAHLHYDALFEKMRQQYPKLKEKDFQYCYLCLLGLDNTQIAAMLQHSISTIWERENRLKKILGSQDRIAVVLNGIMMR